MLADIDAISDAERASSRSPPDSPAKITHKNTPNRRFLWDAVKRDMGKDRRIGAPPYWNYVGKQNF